MRIAHVTPVYPPAGGIGNVARDYAEGLRAHGDDVTVLTPRYNRKIVSFGNAALMPNFLWRLRGFDVIHLHYPFYGGDVFAVFASIFWKTPLVVTYHMKTKAGGWLGLIFKIHRAIVEPFIFAHAKKILVSSNDYAHSVGFEQEKLIELPFGVDTQRFIPAKNPHGDAYTFLFVGGMDAAHYFKGIPVFLEALAELPSEATWRAIFVGGGERLEGYRALADTLGVENKIDFVGRVSDDDLPGCYQKADVHVLPSIDRSEAFGLVTLEAAASGIPSIVSDLPGVRTLVEPNKTGLLVAPGDKASLKSTLTWALDHKEEMRSMGQAARERALRVYAMDVVVEKLRALYRQVTVAL